jgi:hypothetical protein
VAERTVIRELVTIFGFDIDEKELEDFDKRVESTKKNLRRMAIAAGIALGAITAIIVKTVQAGDSIAKMARRLNINTESLQEWREVFDRAGVSQQTFDTGIQRLIKNAGLAASGSKEQAAAFAVLGVEVTDATGKLKSLDVLLPELLESLRTIEDENLRVARAAKILDSEGVGLLQVFDDTNKSLEEQRARIRALGGVMSSELIKKSEETKDSWTDLGSALNGVIFAIGEQLLPIIQPLLQDLAEWISRNRELIILLTKIGFALLFVTSAIFGAIAATALWNLKLLVLNATVGALLVKVLLIPAALIAIAAAISLIVEDINLFFSGAGVRTVTGDFINSLGGFWDILKQGFVGLMQAIWDRLKVIREWILDLPDLLDKKFVAMLDRMERRIVAWRDAILNVLPSFSRIGGSATRAEEQMALAAFGGRGLTPESVGSTVVTNNVTITAAPGQTPEAIATEVVTQIGGTRARSGLIGLGK